MSLITTASQSGKLTSGEVNRSVQMQAQFSEGGVYTVQFLIQSDRNKYINTIADITWYSAGNAVTRRISVTNGTSISGVCENCVVRAYDASVNINLAQPALPLPPDLVQEYLLSIQAGPGNRPATQQPAVYLDTYNNTIPNQRLIGSRIVAAGGAAFVPIPRDVGVISVFIAAANPKDPATGEDTTLASYRTFGSTEQGYIPLNTWTPVPPNASDLALRVDAASPYANIDYFITFGIDG